MPPSLKNNILPRYHGKSWLNVRLPRKTIEWCAGGKKSIAIDCTTEKSLLTTLNDLDKKKTWVWPKRKHLFFSDLHGDPDAFAASLVLSGAVRKTGPKPTDFDLNETGRNANFIIGGDCFDKGPSSLGLLRTIRHLKDLGARVRVLAGNHDVRVLFGMIAVGKNEKTKNEHFFIRTGQKIIPLLKEIWDEYFEGKEGLKNIPGKRTCRHKLYPSSDWFDTFPDIAENHLVPPQITRELHRIKKKLETFEEKCEKSGLNLRQVYASVMKWRELFLSPQGEFHWFYKQMRLAFKSGSFLFVHAGLDNKIAQRLSQDGVKELNRTFKQALKGDPFDFYYGPLCNTVRTKYRNVDHPFTNKGARYVRHAGISAIIHGHRNLHDGQRIALRKNVLNFECDASLDSHTRQNEKIRGRGAAVTIIHPKGKILGLSSDYSHIKLFDPKISLQYLKKKHLKRKVIP